ncbi:ABC transporter permease subunit [Fusibacter paucivorans]|uniref:ABC transporter permease subunit n=1 Tax=Fusibacter paucivorans TaxID=76009 RepID=A0ABS5PN91_9FIRM|nr:ABC transporter permease subunit [Fusibacter paucivorans]MBS7525859.1 ABC transporter permease subunit [Fusibacter paucivorans]
MKLSINTDNNFQSGRHWGYRGLSAIALLITWWILSVMIGKQYIMPSPISVLKEIVNLLTTSTFYYTVFSTIFRTLICVVISLIGGVVLGIASGYYTALRGFLAPFIRIMQTLPTIVVIVYVIIWLSSAIAPIFVTWLITMPIVYANVLEGYDAISVEYREVFAVYELSPMKQLRCLVLPSVKPYLKAAVIAVTSLGLKVMIASEVLGQTQGSIGKSIQIAKINLQTEIVFAWAIVTIVIAISLEALLKKVLL